MKRAYKLITLAFVNLFLFNQVFSQYIIGINPNIAKQGESLQVSITGYNTGFLQSTSTINRSWINKDGVEIDIESINVISDTEYEGLLNIPSSATTGFWSLYCDQTLNGAQNIMALSDEFRIDPGVSFETLKSSGDKWFEVFPNPGSSTLTLSIKDRLLTNGSVIVRNVQGKIIIQQDISDAQHSIDASSLSSGVYLLELWNDDKRVAASHWLKIG